MSTTSQPNFAITCNTYQKLSQEEFSLLAGTPTMEQLIGCRLAIEYPDQDSGFPNLITQWLQENAQGLYHISWKGSFAGTWQGEPQWRGSRCVVYFTTGADRNNLESFIMQHA